MTAPDPNLCPCCGQPWSADLTEEQRERKRGAWMQVVEIVRVAQEEARRAESDAGWLLNKERQGGA